MRFFLAFLTALSLVFSSTGCINYKRQCKRNHKHKLHRDCLEIELKGEEPRYHEQEAFSPTTSWFTSQKMMEKPPRRILLMPLTNPWNSPKVTENTSRLFYNELLKGGFSDIHLLSDSSPGDSEQDGMQWPWSKWPDPIRVGRIQYPELVEAAERYQADAVLYGQVTIYRPTEPPDFGLKAILVQIGPPPCCEVIWAYDAVWDEGDLEIWDRAKQYYVQRTAKHWAKDDVTVMEPHGGTRFYGHRLMLTTMDRYLEFCFYETVKNLRISSLGVRWPHYQYEKKVSPKGDLPVSHLDKEDFLRLTEKDQTVKGEKEKEKEGRRRWFRRDTGRGEGSRRTYPPYLYRELPQPPAQPPKRQTEPPPDSSDPSQQQIQSLSQ
jgi:hypothetical protein